MPNDNVLTDAKVHAAIKHAEEEISRMAPFSSLEERRFAFCRALLTAHPGQSKPCASAGVIAAARAVIEADRAQTLTTEHVNALDNAIKIQRDELTLPEPRAEVMPMKVERHSDMSVLVVFSSCRQASVFEKEIAARTGASS